MLFSTILGKICSKGGFTQTMSDMITRWCWHRPTCKTIHCGVYTVCHFVDANIILVAWKIIRFETEYICKSRHICIGGPPCHYRIFSMLYGIHTLKSWQQNCMRISKEKMKTTEGCRPTTPRPQCCMLFRSFPKKL